MSRLHSLVRSSPPGLYVRRRRYESALSPEASAAPDVDVAREVIHRGIAMIPEHLDEPQLSAVQKEVRSALTGAEGNAWTDVDLEAAEFAALTSVARDPFLSGSMDAIAGAKMQLFGVRAHLRRPGLDEPDIDLWHTDTWRLRLKAMLFIESVGPADGPMHYAAGSHLRSIGHPERSAYDVLREVRQQSGGTLAAVAARRGEDEVVGVGQAGAMAIFDPRGFHMATVPSRGERLTATFTFVRTLDLAA